MLLVFQGLFILFALAAIVNVTRRYRQGDFGIRGAWFWSIFWVAAMIVVALPENASRIAHVFGIGRGVDLVLYVSVAAIFFVLFRLHIKLEGLKRDLTKLV